MEPSTVLEVRRIRDLDWFSWYVHCLLEIRDNWLGKFNGIYGRIMKIKQEPPNVARLVTIY